ncbi:hypothetical protein [Caballeronia sordidicola]|nr:hypothetical protein [Caballeronia sordidicola]
MRDLTDTATRDIGTSVFLIGYAREADIQVENCTVESSLRRPGPMRSRSSRNCCMVRTDLALPAGVGMPALVVSAGERAGVRFPVFFASSIRSSHRRRA